MANGPIRVLCVVYRMDIDGGIERALYNTYQFIDKERVQLDFYICSEKKSPMADKITAMGSRIFYNETLSIRNFPKYTKKFAAFLEDHPEYKIVHVHLNQWCSIFLKGAKKAGVRVRIAHSHTALAGHSLKIIIKNIIKLPVNRYATHRFAASRKAGFWLFGNRAMNENKVEILPNALNYQSFAFNATTRAHVRKEHDLRDSLTVIHVGNLAPVKNHKFLLEVFNELIKKEPDSRLLLIGQDLMNGFNQKLAAAYGIADKVHFMGIRNDVPDLLQAGDVFVFPSLYEGLPNAVLEAQASGLPCIISDTISDEIKVTPLVEQLPLSLTAEQWAENILKRTIWERESAMNYFEISRYNINILIGWLTTFYENALKETGLGD